ncbi:hypothetical protein V6N13_079268 [Hibiscus sabdariffa]|uniref:Helicase ATP-binding domain-containing protein n=1 Tax=Hibiscus sabdariffa TaxID=183260 RepID=A0ABR2RQY1_9ROSI
MIRWRVFLSSKKDVGLTLTADALRAGYDSDEEVNAAAKAVDAGMSEQEVDEYRKSLAIRVSGYEKPTTFLCQALPIVLSGRDVIGMAKTGSGKTASFVLPMIVHIMDQPELQEEEAKKFAKAYGIRTSAVYSGMSKLDQSKELKAGCEIVVATPGRLIDLLKMKALTMSRATYLVLDEANQMFDLGFEPQIRSIVGQNQT